MLVGGLLLVLLAIVIALFEGSWPLLYGSVLVGYGICATAAVIDRGWRPGRYGRVEQGGVVVVALACLFVAGSAALDAGQTPRCSCRRSEPRRTTPPSRSRCSPSRCSRSRC